MRHRKTAFAVRTLALILGISSVGLTRAAPELRWEGIVWSSVGSAGAVEPTSVRRALLGKAILSMKAPGRLVVRYNVPPIPELVNARGTLRLMANCFDPGPGAALNVALIEVDLDALNSRVLLAVNSKDESPAEWTDDCVAEPDARQLDFEKHVYYIVATLSWDATVQSRPPSLRALRIGIYESNECGR